MYGDSASLLALAFGGTDLRFRPECLLEANCNVLDPVLQGGIEKNQNRDIETAKSHESHNNCPF